jgi:histidyl-tRNA synthetase
LLPKDKEFIQTPHLFVAALGEETVKEAYRIINQLHLQGIRAELDYEGKSLKSQMRRADKLKARYVLILGEEELKKGNVVLRNMETKSQEELPIKDLLNVIIDKVKRV